MSLSIHILKRKESFRHKLSVYNIIHLLINYSLLSSKFHANLYKCRYGISRFFFEFDKLIFYLIIHYIKAVFKYMYTFPHVQQLKFFGQFPDTKLKMKI